MRYLEKVLLEWRRSQEEFVDRPQIFRSQYLVEKGYKNVYATMDLVESMTVAKENSTLKFNADKDIEKFVDSNIESLPF